MIEDVECPYCGKWQEINHDDGYGFEEDEKHEQYCGNCGKNFVYTTCIIYQYDAYKADCLNGKNHDLQPTNTIPKWATKMRCKDCGFERYPNENEKKIYSIPHYKEV